MARPSRVIVAVLLSGIVAVAWAAVPKVRIQGAIESVRPNAFAIKSYSGRTVHLTLTPQTKFASVVPAKLSDIKSGDFVGVGATGPENDLSAVEVVIFPNAMRGTGEGHYGWSLPAAVARADHYQGASSAPVWGTMTNGTVAQSSTNNSAAVHGTMTNGTVAGTGSRKLTVSYRGGKPVQIAVKPTTPIVRLIPTDRSVLKPQAKAFAAATKEASGATKLSASFVAVGQGGLTPPM